MRRVLVTGANGFVGSALVRHLQEKGFQVRCAVRRSNVPGDRLCDTVAVGDIGSGTDWHSALAGIDSVIHLAASVHVLKEHRSDSLAAFREVNVEGTRRLAEQAASNGIKRLVYLSSVGVLGHHGAFSERTQVSPWNLYTVSKWEAEQTIHSVAQHCGLEYVIVRPPLVYGPGNPGNFLRLLHWISKGLPLPLASIENKRSFIGIDNLVDFLTTCITHPRAANETFLVADSETISTPELIRRLAGFMGVKARLFPFPVALLRMGAKLLGKGDVVSRLADSLVISCDKAKQLLSWVAKTSLIHGLEQTVQWYKQAYNKRFVSMKFSL